MKLACLKDSLSETTYRALTMIPCAPEPRTSSGSLKIMSQGLICHMRSSCSAIIGSDLKYDHCPDIVGRWQASADQKRVPDQRARSHPSNAAANEQRYHSCCKQQRRQQDRRQQYCQRKAATPRSESTRRACASATFIRHARLNLSASTLPNYKPERQIQHEIRFFASRSNFCANEKHCLRIQLLMLAITITSTMNLLNASADPVDTDTVQIR